MSSQCAVGRAGTVPGRTESPESDIERQPQKGRGRCSTLIGSYARRPQVDAPIPGAIKAVYQLVVSRYGRLQGPLRRSMQG